MDGVIKKGDKVQFMATGKEYEVIEIGKFLHRLLKWKN